MSLDITRFCKGNIHRYFRVFILILSSVSFTDVNHWRSLFVRVRPQSPEISTLFFSRTTTAKRKFRLPKSRCNFVFFFSPSFGKIREKSSRSIDFDRCVHFLFCRSFFFSFRFLEYCLFAHRLDEIPGKMN